MHFNADHVWPTKNLVIDHQKLEIHEFDDYKYNQFGEPRTQFPEATSFCDKFKSAWKPVKDWNGWAPLALILNGVAGIVAGLVCGGVITASGFFGNLPGFLAGPAVALAMVGSGAGLVSAGVVLGWHRIVSDDDDDYDDYNPPFVAAKPVRDIPRADEPKKISEATGNPPPLTSGSIDAIDYSKKLLNQLDLRPYID